VVAWVQRTGGDMARLCPADMEDEDTEAAVRADNLGELPAPLAVHFAPGTLLSCDSARAQAALAQSWPALLRQPGVVLNLGDMWIEGLPAGFLPAA
jgi:hypothetical protein